MTSSCTYAVGYFDSEDAILAATRKARDAGHRVADVFTPYAVHGLDEAMGLRPSRLPWVCFIVGMTGATLAMGFQVWTSTVSWPLNVGGKPFASVPAFIPVTFEVTVLTAALSSALAFFLRSKLFPGKRSIVLPHVTDDRFALALAGGTSAEQTFLIEAGATDVQVTALQEAS